MTTRSIPPHSLATPGERTILAIPLPRSFRGRMSCPRWRAEPAGAGRRDGAGAGRRLGAAPASASRRDRARQLSLRGRRAKLPALGPSGGRCGLAPRLLPPPRRPAAGPFPVGGAWPPPSAADWRRSGGAFGTLWVPSSPFQRGRAVPSQQVALDAAYRPWSCAGALRLLRHCEAAAQRLTRQSRAGGRWAGSTAREERWLNVGWTAQRCSRPAAGPFLVGTTALGGGLEALGRSLGNPGGSLVSLPVDRRCHCRRGRPTEGVILIVVLQGLHGFIAFVHNVKSGTSRPERSEQAPQGGRRRPERSPVGATGWVILPLTLLPPEMGRHAGAPKLPPGRRRYKQGALKPEARPGRPPGFASARAIRPESPPGDSVGYDVPQARQCPRRPLRGLGPVGPTALRAVRVSLAPPGSEHHADRRLRALATEVCEICGLAERPSRLRSCNGSR